jgi:hypothetical protein
MTSLRGFLGELCCFLNANDLNAVSMGEAVLLVQKCHHVHIHTFDLSVYKPPVYSRIPIARPPADMHALHNTSRWVKRALIPAYNVHADPAARNLTGGETEEGQSSEAYVHTPGLF